MNGVTFTKMENTPGIAFEKEPIESNCGLAEHEGYRQLDLKFWCSRDRMKISNPHVGIKEFLKKSE